MTTARGMETTSLDASPALGQLGQPAALHSFPRRRMAEKFLKGEPKVLGCVQILIALINFSLGIIIMSVIVPAFDPHPIVFNLAYPIWGSVMFIISGSLSIAAGATTTKGMIQSSLGLNVTSSVLAALGIILTAITMNILSFENPICNRVQMPDICFLTLFIVMGLEVMVFILSLLEFCIAVTLSAFGCKVICCNLGGVVVILPPNPHMAQTPSPAPFKEGLTPPTNPEENIS